MTTIDAKPAAAETPPAAAAPHHHGRPAHLAHHFDSSQQQFEAGKFGMWMFLATEVLLFGGLFCGYAVFRGNNPEIFNYGSAFLDTRWGAINTAVLILSSLSMASAVTAAQQGRKRLLIALLMMTFMGGAVFMGIKYIEYHHKIHENLVWGVAFYDKPDWVHEAEAHPPEEEAVVAAEPAHVADAANGGQLWLATCRSCHGLAGEGVAGQGKDIRGSEFITSRTDGELIDFIKIGRMPFDPLNTTGIQMPPKGGNPLLSDQDLLDIVAFVRTFEAAPGPSAPSGAPAVDATQAEPEAFWIPVSTIPLAPPGPPGLAVEEPAEVEAVEPEEVAHYPHHSVDPDRPDNAHLFFAFYFCMTGLHGLHVLAGMAMLAWLSIGAIRGIFGPAYFTPVDLGGLY
ncbi:MAG: c-type cytochrome, partial [Planctomycetota bacterium]